MLFVLIQHFRLGFLLLAAVITGQPVRDQRLLMVNDAISGVPFNVLANPHPLISYCTCFLIILIMYQVKVLIVICLQGTNYFLIINSIHLSGYTIQPRGKTLSKFNVSTIDSNLALYSRQDEINDDDNDAEAASAASAAAVALAIPLSLAFALLSSMSTLGLIHRPAKISHSALSVIKRKKISYDGDFVVTFSFNFFHFVLNFIA